MYFPPTEGLATVQTVQLRPSVDLHSQPTPPILGIATTVDRAILPQPLVVTFRPTHMQTSKQVLCATVS